MGMMNEEREKHIRIASMLIGAIHDLIRPMLMCQIEKDVAKEALENYIKMLEQQPCEDCISREQTLKVFAEKCGGECACCEYNGSGYDNAENCKLIKSMPSVTPSITDVENDFNLGYNCGYADAMNDIAESEE